MSSHAQLLEEIQHCVRSENHKKAIKTASKLPNVPLAQAMSAYSEIRLGQKDAAVQKLDKLMWLTPKTVPNPVLLDGNVSLWIGHALRFLGDSNEALTASLSTVKLLEAKNASGPAYAEAVDAAFEAACRALNATEIKKLSMKLSKSVDNKELLFFAATAILLEQPSTETHAVMADMLFQEATTSGVDNNNVKALKLAVRVRKHQYAEALKDLEEKLKPSEEAERHWTRFLLLEAQESPDPAAAFAVLLTSLRECASDDVRVQVAASKLASKHSERRAELEKIYRASKSRGHLMGLVCLAFFAFAEGDGDQTGESLTSALIEYLEYGWPKPCAVSDVRNYLQPFFHRSAQQTTTEEAAAHQGLTPRQRLNPRSMSLAEHIERDDEDRCFPDERVSKRVAPAQRERLVRFLSETTTSPTSSPRARLSALELSRILRAKHPQELSQVLEAARFVFEQIIRPSEQAKEEDTRDEGWVFLSHVVVDGAALLPTAREKQRLLTECAALLESARKTSVWNHQLALMLHELYGAHGLLAPPLSASVNLHIKHIQYDSCGYLLLRDGSDGGLQSNASFVGPALEFYTLAKSELGKSCSTCQEERNFSMMMDVFRLNERLTRSEFLARLRLESLYAGLMSKKLVNDFTTTFPMDSSLLRLKLEWLDPTKTGLDWLPRDHRLAKLEGADFSAQCYNEDWSIQSSWETPFESETSTSLFHGPNEILARPHRSSKAQKRAWKSRVASWKVLRFEGLALLAESLFKPNPATSLQRLKRVEDAANSLGLLSSDSLKLETAMWVAAMDLMRLLTTPTPESALEALAKTEQDLNTLAQLATEETFAEFTSESVEPKRLAALSHAVGHAGLWCALIFSAWSSNQAVTPHKCMNKKQMRKVLQSFDRALKGLAAKLGQLKEDWKVAAASEASEPSLVSAVFSSAPETQAGLLKEYASVRAKVREAHAGSLTSLSAALKRLSEMANAPSANE